jgi:hypothetical protein
MADFGVSFCGDMQKAPTTAQNPIAFAGDEKDARDDDVEWKKDGDRKKDCNPAE